MLELGQAIVRQLEINQRGEQTSRWMAHHLAELITTAQAAEGDAKRLAEDRAAELILKLWARRRDLPMSADPLHGYLEAIKVLGAMLPTANPWRQLQRGRSDEALLCGMFDSLVNLVMSGLLLTRNGDIRKIEDAEWDSLSEEERFLVETLNRWRELFVPPTSEEFSLNPIFVTIRGGDDESEANVGKLDRSALKDPRAESEEDLHGSILVHIERFQAKLSELIEQWREKEGNEADEASELDD